MMKHNISFDTFFDDFFNRSIADIVGSDATFNTPSANVIENEDAFVIKIAAPGLRKEDFDITIDKNQLVVKVNGNKTEEEHKERSKAKFTRKEFNYESFTRRFHIPKGVKKDEIEGQYDLGILNITMHKEVKAKENGPIKVEIL